MEMAPKDGSLSSSPGTEVGCDEKSQLLQLNRPEESAPSSRPADSAGDISRKELIGLLNLVNFQGETICANFKSTTRAASICVQVRPQPCRDSRLACTWAEKVDPAPLNDAYRFDSLIISHGRHRIEARPELKGLSDTHLFFRLPITSRRINARRQHRYACSQIGVFLLQNSALFQGTLTDFSALQFRVRINTAPPQTFHWIDPEMPVNVVFSRGQETLYSGECRITRQDDGRDSRHINLAPVNNRIRRFAPREFRNPRHQLKPSPDLLFRHPFFDKPVVLKALDISGSGIAVEEVRRMAVLLPGMVIPELEVLLSDGTSLSGSAQVVYSRPHRGDGEEATLRCGLAFLDMPPQDHIRLLRCLHRSADERSYLCPRLDPDALWDFYFEAGLVEPATYGLIEGRSKNIRETCAKLNAGTSRIARHFTFQENGRILAHAAMLRFYERSWLIHHHAAVGDNRAQRALKVLSQVGRFINESHQLYSMKMDYAFAFYKAEDKFPGHVYGGAARNIGDPGTCSLDLLAGFHHRINAQKQPTLPEGWSLSPACRNDLGDLRSFYENESGGLMLQALQLDPDMADTSALSEEFAREGLKRDRRIFALRCREKLRALLVAEIADSGLSLSGFTSSLLFIILDPRPFNPELVNAAAAAMSAGLYEDHEVPVLIYPRHRAEDIGIDCENSYVLWAYDTRNLDPYFIFLKRLAKFIRH